eukprot:TRINITY_DN637_c0_g1_i1.p1 TRINITY_DN637_c0_g1~~TRINITY_DN637_c0_g1_i1.p1  ORF type:complete len:194 (-),score=36.07 TRINITY_DN637_c0_g1_i1:119-700(-)
MPKEKINHIQRQKVATQSVRVPFHRLAHVKQHWEEIYTPIVEQCKLEIRMNIKARTVDIRPSPETPDTNLVGKAAEFVRAVTLGFEVRDALALLRMEDIYIDTFEVGEVRQTLHDQALLRAVGRMAGTRGKTKFAVENLTRTRVVIDDKTVHVMGTDAQIKLARRALSELVCGAPADKVAATLQVANRKLTGL